MDEMPADRLRQARIARGYQTAKQFSDTHGLAQSTYSVHESGKRGLTRDTALHYADILQISVEWLLAGKGEGPESNANLAKSKEIQDDLRNKAAAIIDQLSDEQLKTVLPLLEILLPSPPKDDSSS